MLGLYGGADTGIPNESVEKMQRRAQGRQRGGKEVADRSSIRTRRTASTPTTARAIRKEQAEDGWKMALAWFKANGVS